MATAKELQAQLLAANEMLAANRTEVSQLSELVRSQADAIQGHLATIAAQKVSTEELSKKLASSESYQKTYREGTEKAEAEIEQLHQVLDGMEGALARKSDAENSWERVDRSVLTRLCSWLANGKRG